MKQPIALHRSGVFGILCLGLSLAALPASAQRNAVSRSAGKRVERPARVASTPKRVQPTVPNLAPISYQEVNSLSAVRKRIQQLETQLEQCKKANAAHADRKGEPAFTDEKPLRKQLNFWRAREYYLLPRAYPNDTVDQQIGAQARAHRDLMPLATKAMMQGARPAQPNGPIVRASMPGQNGVRWTSNGPRNMTSRLRTFFGPGTMSGRINGVAFDPQDQRIFYAASASGGLWRSMDSGRTWRPLTDYLPALATTCVTIDPTNRNNIYLGTGDYNGFNLFSDGLYRSTDFGATWQQVPGIPTSDAIRQILIDPTNPRHILVSCGTNGIWRVLLDNNNLVADVRQVFTPQPQILETNPFAFIPAGRVSNLVYNLTAVRQGGSANGARVYASVDNEGIYSSTDNGATWQPIGIGTTLPRLRPFTSEQRLDVAASMVDANRLFIISNAQHQIFRSNDAGASFANITNNFPSHVLFGDFENWNQTFYNFYIRAGAASVRLPTGIQQQDVLYVGMVDFYQGRPNPLRPASSMNWTSIGLCTTSNAQTHVDQHGFAFNPRNFNDILLGNDGGVTRYAFNAGNGTHRFTPINADLTVTQSYWTDWAEFSATTLISGTQDNGTIRPVGTFGRWEVFQGGDGGFCAINPDNSDNQYATIYPSGGVMPVFRTDDNWRSSISIPVDYPDDDDALFIYPITLDKTNPNLVYAGSTRLWRYTSTGPGQGSWQEVTDSENTRLGNYITSISVSRTDNRIIYMGTPGRVWVYRPAPTPQNPNRTLFDNITGNLPNRYVTQVLCSPINPNRVYAVLGGTGAPHVWRRDIGFGGWVNISGQDGTGNPTSPVGLPNVNVNCIALGPSEDESVIYVGTDIGVFITNDGGQSWSRASGPEANMPYADVRTLNFVTTTGLLHAGTFGRGTFSVELGNDVPLVIQPRFENYNGDRTQLRVLVEVYSTVPGLRQRPLERRVVTLSSAGWAYVPLSTRGYVDLYVTAPRFLRRYFGRIQTTTSNGAISAIMYNGDVNGDGVINGADLTQVSQRFGQFVGPEVLEDVNGDGVINEADIRIVVRNSGRTQDNP